MGVIGNIGKLKKNMIPKIIHYCWYGRKPLSDTILMCIDSWKKYCPDYEIKCWNEDNSPLNLSWTKEAMKHQKYAFVADYVRFYALYNEGGIYLDTDMLIVKPIDGLLIHDFFIGIEDDSRVSMGIIGSIKGFLLNKICLSNYDNMIFDMVNPPVITKLLTPIFMEYGFIESDHSQLLSNNIKIYSTEYFYPIPYLQEFTIEDIPSYCTDKTYAVHLWNKSWSSEFTFLEERKYRKAFSMLCQRVKRTPLLPLRFYVKLFSTVLRLVAGEKGSNFYKKLKFLHK